MAGDGFQRLSERNLKISLKDSGELFMNNSKLIKHSNNNMENLIRKIERFLKQHSIIDTSESENKVEELDGNPTLQAITLETTATKVNTVLSTPSAFVGETFPAVDSKNCVISIVPRNLKFIESQ